jgi:hypothetical protein
MKLSYTYYQSGKFYIGYLDDYPEHPTEAFSLEELEENLEDIYSLILSGKLDSKKHGTLYYEAAAA